jgi:predicted dehydrogenase
MAARIGIVGLNHGYVMAEKARRIRSVELVAACARNIDKHRERVAALQVPFYDTVEGMLDNARVDGVIISVSTDRLVSVAKQCLERGVAVLVEKPAGATLSEALLLKQSATAAQGIVVVGYHRRLSHQLIQLRALLASNLIGEVREISCKWLVKKPDGYFEGWRVRRDSGGGCLMINAVHEIDTLQYLFGPIVLVAAVAGKSQFPMSDVEHSLAITMQFECGQVATALFSDERPSPYSYESTVAAGTKFPQYSADCYHFFGPHGCLAFPSFTLHCAQTNSASWFDPLRSSVASSANTAADDPLSREIDLFSRVITEGAPPHATVDDAIRNLAVVESIRRSLMTSAVETVRLTTGALSTLSVGAPPAAQARDDLLSLWRARCREWL